MLVTFGYMDFMIYYKWSQNYIEADLWNTIFFDNIVNETNTTNTTTYNPYNESMIANTTTNILTSIAPSIITLLM